MWLEWNILVFHFAVIDPKVKAYAQISAISEAFKVLQQGVIDKEAQDQIRAIKETLDQLEGGTPNVIDV